MSQEARTPVTRRRVLGLAAGAALGSVAIDPAAAGVGDSVKLNVGYSSASGKRAAVDAADEVVYEFGFDALTILAPAQARETLALRDDIRYAEMDGEVRALGIRRVFISDALGGHKDDEADNGENGETDDQGRADETNNDRDTGQDRSENGEDNRDERADDGRDNRDGNGDDDDEDDDEDDEDSGGGTCETGDQPYTWGIDRVDADVAHTNCDTGSGADIAIIDTGIDQYHSDLQANLGEGVGFIAGQKSPNWQDDDGHGTHCAGVAAAVDNDRGVVGISTEATLHAVKVLQAFGGGLSSDVAKGIEWTADQGYDVGNLSLSARDFSVIKDACDAAADAGVLLVAAAGNSGSCTDCVTYPAAYDSVVAVSATSCDDSLARFSSTGPEVELAAPGEDIYSTYTASTPVTDTFATLDGTSMACPHVSGAAGQLMATGDDNQEARDQLASTAEDIGLGSNEQGNGLVDVAAALDYDSSDNGTGNGPNC